MMTIIAYLLVLVVIVYFAVELGWGGGNSRNPNHNPPNERF